MTTSSEHREMPIAPLTAEVDEQVLGQLSGGSVTTATMVSGCCQYSGWLGNEGYACSLTIECQRSCNV